MLTLPDFSATLLPWIVASSCILFRLIGIIIVMPFSQTGRIPQRVRVTFSLYLTLGFFFSLGLPAIQPPESVAGWFALLLPEILLGFALGLFVRVLLGSAAAMGQLASTTVGLGFATFVDPSTGAQTDVMGRLMLLLAAVVFVAMDGHHLVFRAMFEGLQTVPVGTADFTTLSRGGYAIASLGSDLFLLALRMAAPVMAGGLMLYTVLGVIARVAPQINLFAFGFVLTIPAGILLLMVEMPEFVALIETETEELPLDMLHWTVTGALR